MKTYEVDFNINYSAASLAAFLNRITPFMNSIDDRESVPGCVDLKKCRYLGPDAAVILALLHHEARSRGLSASMRLPTGPEPLSAFCRYVGLSSMLGVGSPPDEDHPSCETVQLRQWRGVPGLEGQRIVKLVRRHDTMHDDEAEYLTQAFNELVQNVDDHSKSGIGCVWCARYFAATREVRVAVGDRGRGILASLQTRHPEFKSSRRDACCS